MNAAGPCFKSCAAYTRTIHARRSRMARSPDRGRDTDPNDTAVRRSRRKGERMSEGQSAAAGKGKYYMISVVANNYGIHPQTLRLYEREGLLKPSRTEGN